MIKVARWLLLGVAVLTGAMLIGGCGSAPPPAPGPLVTLHMSLPRDGSRTSAASTTVTGRVKPVRAKITVLGRAVHVTRSGRFQTSVHLGVGTNLIDVLASLPRSSGAMTALRVVRFLLVSVPDVTTDDTRSATAALKSLNLRATVSPSHDPLAFLLPFSQHVCTTTPPAGTRVNPGSTVILHTAKICV
ncbi:MAG: PASTA domain-containing protein [Solirubrobacterales bacterium]|nr:PASTA domain-containing protein [Solirubrobacterales bacterium]